MKSFLSGLVLFILGLYFITQNTIVTTGFNLRFLTGGYNPPLGLLLVPLLIGIVLLFTMEKQTVGWIIIIISTLVIIVGILMGLHFYFKPVTLYKVLLMFGSVAAGLGLMIRGVIESNKSY